MQQTTTEDPMTIIALKISGYKRCRAVYLKPDPTGLVELNGRNEQGKSTILDAIKEGLEGGRKPTDPIHEGRDRADINIDLGDLVVWIRYTDPNDPSKYAIDIKNKIGGKVEGGERAVMDALRSKLVDPTKFALMSAPEQTREVMAMVNLPIDLAKNKLAESAAKQKRALADSQVKELEGKVAELQQAAADAPSERVDLAALTADFQEATDHNKIWDETEKRRQDCLEEYRDAKQALTDHQDKILELEKQLLALREATPGLETAIEETVERGKNIKAELEALGDKRDTEAINKQIKDAQASAAAYSAADRLHEREQDLKEKIKQRDDAKAEVEAARKQAKDALAAAEFPIDGMGYDPDTELVTHNGKPLKQASQGRLVLIGAELAMAKQPAPRIRVLFCREGSFVDAVNMQKLAQLAHDKGWQIWMEKTIDEPNGTGVWIEDGLAVGDIAQEVV